MDMQTNSTDTTSTYEVPNGDIVYNETVLVSPVYANALLSENIGNYSSVQLVNDKVELVSRLCTCTNCKSSFFINGNGTNISPDVILMLGTDKIPRIMNGTHHAVKISDGSITCPFCDTKNNEFTENREVTISTSENKIIVSTSVDYEHRNDSLNPNLRNYTQSQFPLTTEIVFGKQTHRTFLEVSDNCGNEMLKTDLSFFINPAFDWAISDFINKNKELKENLLNLLTSFTELTNEQITNTTLGDLVLYNRFKGYNKDFYNSIPFEKLSVNIHHSFSKIADKLSDIENLPEIYKEYNLPEQKSIKKHIFSHPQILFYAKELSMLPFYKTSNLYKFLNSDKVYQFLSEIHDAPFLTDMLKLMIDEKDETNVVNLLIKSSDISSTLEKYKSPFEYQIPLKHESEGEYDFVIGRYQFCELSSSFDYAIAGMQLRNCLQLYTFSDKRIIGVKKNRNYVAAIEIEDNKITQAVIENDLYISSNPDVYEAYSAWMKEKKLIEIDAYSIRNYR